MKISARSLVFSAAVLIAISVCVEAHSWVACTDYKINSQDDANYYKPGNCKAYARNWESVASDFGVDRGFDFQASETKTCRNSLDTSYNYPSQYPMAQYAPGQTVCLAWPSKNHVAATCTNQYIPDNGLKLYAYGPNPSADPTQSGFKNLLIADMGGHQNGVIDFKGFQNCPKFCENMDKSLCTGCFEVPTNLVQGAVYTFQWYWVFNQGAAPYTSCWEAKITGSAGGTTTGKPATTGVVTTGRVTTGQQNPTTGQQNPTTGQQNPTTGQQNPTTTGGVITGNLPAGDHIIFTKYPTQIKTLGTFVVEVSYSANGNRDIVVDILDNVLPTPNWYGKGIATVSSGQGSSQIMVKVTNPLTMGLDYILRAWIVQAGKGEADQGWAYELDRQDMSVHIGSDFVYESVNATFNKSPAVGNSSYMGSFGFFAAIFAILGMILTY